MRLSNTLRVSVAAGFLMAAMGSATAQKKYDTGATDSRTTALQRCDFSSKWQINLSRLKNSYKQR